MFEGKENCLCLDFGGNIAEHGPLNLLRLDNRSKGELKYEKKDYKICESCGVTNNLEVKTCVECGNTFKVADRGDPTEKLTGFASKRKLIDAYPVHKSQVLELFIKVVTGKKGIPMAVFDYTIVRNCLLYTSPSPRDATLSRMPSSA